MTKSSLFINSEADSQPVLEEVEHIYWNDNHKIKYLSVTTLVGMYKPKKCWFGIAYRYAKKNGETMAFWLARWKQEGDVGKNRGTVFHKGQEDLTDMFEVVEHEGKNYRVQGDGAGIGLSELPDGLYREIKVWHRALKIAGTADIVFIETDKDGKRWVTIDDYKTNKEIKYAKGFGPYNYINKANGRYVVNSFMREPLGNLVDCDYVHYQLQVSIYAWMFWNCGYNIKKLGFTHFPRATGSGIYYHCPFLFKEVVNMLTHYAC